MNLKNTRIYKALNEKPCGEVMPSLLCDAASWFGNTFQPEPNYRKFRTWLLRIRFAINNAR